jgi:hypothetical protein
MAAAQEKMIGIDQLEPLKCQILDCDLSFLGSSFLMASSRLQLLLGRGVAPRDAIRQSLDMVSGWGVRAKLGLTGGAVGGQRL